MFWLFERSVDIQQTEVDTHPGVDSSQPKRGYRCRGGGGAGVMFQRLDAGFITFHQLRRDSHPAKRTAAFTGMRRTRQCDGLADLKDFACQSEEREDLTSE